MLQAIADLEQSCGHLKDAKETLACEKMRVRVRARMWCLRRNQHDMFEVCVCVCVCV